MKCVACKLENPQSEEFCFSCMHPLDLSRINTEPPRQTRVGKAAWTLFSGPSASRKRRILLQPFRHRFSVWLLSAIPGLGHLLSRYPHRALALFTAWLVICAVRGDLSLRPQGYCMMLQCFAMSDAYRIATERHVGLLRMIAVNVVSAITLALLEMIFIGGILW